MNWFFLFMCQHVYKKKRGYWYKGEQFESDEIETDGPQAKCKGVGIECDKKNQTAIVPMSFPLSRQWMVDNEVNLEHENPKVKSGVTFSDGDGTVSVLSLGTMCVDGWKKKIYNPSGVRMFSHHPCLTPRVHSPLGFVPGKTFFHQSLHLIQLPHLDSCPNSRD
jgi:phospholipid:diacylglycerol acyltransferase